MVLGTEVAIVAVYRLVLALTGAGVAPIIGTDVAIVAITVGVVTVERAIAVVVFSIGTVRFIALRINGWIPIVAVSSVTGRVRPGGAA